MRLDSFRFVALLGLTLVAGATRSARAQQPSACVSATGSDTGVAAPRPPAAAPSVARADSGRTALRILASATADEVRFVGSPRICVRLTGDAQLDSVRVTARRNLASPVVSGTTYKNVYVAVEILGRLNAECIAARITGQPADTAGAGRCASLGVQAATGARP